MERKLPLVPYEPLAETACSDPSGNGWNEGYLGKINRTKGSGFASTRPPTTTEVKTSSTTHTGILKITRKCSHLHLGSTLKPATMPSRRHPSYHRIKFIGTRDISSQFLPGRGTGTGSGTGAGIGLGTGSGFWPCRSGIGKFGGTGSESISSVGTGSSRFPITGPAEGSGTETGSGCKPFTGSAPDPKLVTPPTEIPAKEGSVFDGDYVPSSAFKTQKIIRLPKRRLRLHASKTLYGTKETNLGVEKNIILKPRFVRTGREYLLAFKAEDVENGNKMGLVSVYFHVNVNPERGSCSITPEVGIEMDTDFNLECRGWSDLVSC